MRAAVRHAVETHRAVGLDAGVHEHRANLEKGLLEVSRLVEL